MLKFLQAGGFEGSEVRGNPSLAEGKPHFRASTESDIYLFILCVRVMFYLSPPDGRGQMHYERKRVLLESLKAPKAFSLP